jgi:hypothetical protein
MELSDHEGDVLIETSGSYCIWTIAVGSQIQNAQAGQIAPWWQEGHSGCIDVRERTIAHEESEKRNCSKQALVCHALEDGASFASWFRLTDLRHT